jgi:fluoride exporter
MKTLLLVALGGATGSVLRWIMAGAVQRWSGSLFPWGTFAVNVLGSLAIGFVAALALERAVLSPAVRQLLMIGLLGGFTTFSALSYETFSLLREGQWLAAGMYGGGSLVAGLTATVAGFALGMRL